MILFHNGSVLGGTNSLTSLTPRSFILIVVTLTAGTTLLMWMGELITQRGMGNGISLLIFASIVARLPQGFQSWWTSPDQFFRVVMPFLAIAIVAPAACASLASATMTSVWRWDAPGTTFTQYSGIATLATASGTSVVTENIFERHLRPLFLG